ncbi:MAG: isochorismatase family protein [Leptospiraceae bacterium]|nr:isochorismatase family protein [Leptospiraceae bacterium]
MVDSILITQCLQNDFVELIDKYEPIPNQLHVGFMEAKRLLGEKIEDGPINTLMEWAYETKETELDLIHIRDWHDNHDPKQKDHLNQFGEHCIQNTYGAEFVFSKLRNKNRKDFIVNASGLNDFYNTNLEEILSSYDKTKPIKVGISGVWTEAKVTFLAYELKTRYPNFEIATCSLITAGSNRQAHFIALEQMKNILGINVFTSISEFTNFLVGSVPVMERKIRNASFVQMKFEDNYSVSQDDSKILQYLFREAREASFKCLDGGFSGNVVLKAKVIDNLGHSQVPTVVKIGAREPIARERNSFERIQEVLGNNAPSIVDFAEFGERGAIKYRYASMLEGNVKTFQKFYAESNDIEKIQQILEVVFKKQLGRLYEASSNEKLNLLEYYDFNPKYSSGVRTRVEKLIGTVSSDDTISFFDKTIPNVCKFYEKELVHLKEKNSLPRYMSFIHGDLNGANIILDGGGNIWIIDFFHTHKGHILKDLIKLENDILYIFMKIEDETSFKDALELLDILIDVSDLGVAINKNKVFKNPEIQKAYEIVIYLRSFYSELIELDRDPYQLFCGLMRYAMHTLSFDESNEWQKKLAFYSGSKLSGKIKSSITSSSLLRIDFLINERAEEIGKLALTILPGRKDRDRNLEEDLDQIQKKEIQNILILVTEHELEEYGVSNLKAEYAKRNLEFKHLPLLDQGVPTKEALNPILDWILEKTKAKQNVLIHCVGGLGRSGTVAACFLKKFYGYDSSESIQIVRKSRSKRAVESVEQEEFIFNF